MVSAPFKKVWFAPPFLEDQHFATALNFCPIYFTTLYY